MGTKEVAKIAVAVVGARGYTGLELCRILSKHPQIALRKVYATGDFRLSDYMSDKGAAEVATGKMENLALEARDYKVVFLATPHEVSIDLAPELLRAGCHVIDLSGAFRLQQGDESIRRERFQKWYKIEHKALDLVGEAVFGLSPFAQREVQAAVNRKSPVLISNPGCYATAIMLAAIPLLKSGLVEASSMVIDAKSGTSGAGRKAAENLLFTEVDGECLPYRVGQHQHLPEICEYVQKYSGVSIDPMMTTSLLSTRRGIIAALYFKLSPAGLSLAIQKGTPNEGAQAGTAKESTQKLEAQVVAAFAAAFEGYPLAQVRPLRDGEKLLSLKRVVGSARTQITYQIVDNKVYVFSLIDNLIKGAAGQAVENLNTIFGWPVETALIEMEGVL